MSYRTDRQRVQGLGVAHTGVEHWWVQRVYAAALIPLTVLFIFPFARALGSGWEAARAVYASPFNAIIAMLFFLAAFNHMRLGLQDIIEDYVHQKTIRTVLLVLNVCGCWALALIGIFAVARIAFTA